MVEDNTGDVLLVREALKLHGLLGELFVVTDGERAIEFVQRIDADAAQICPALVLLDLNLPKKSGHEVLKFLRLSRRCANVPVAILSSSDTPGDRQAALKLGANRYIRKPSSLDKFMAIGAVLRAMLEAS